MQNENQYGEGLYSEGMFYFTNPTAREFTALWNNKEYRFPPKSTVPLIIANEPPENVQYIRKQFAKRLAVQEYMQTKDFKKRENAVYVPATYNEDAELAPMIQACLTPMPKAHAAVKDLPKETEENYKGTKVVAGNANLESVFKDYDVPLLGEM